MKTLKKLRAWAGKQTEFKIAFLAGLVWFAFYLCSFLIGTESYPVGMFQKIAFGILAMSIIQGVSWYLFKNSNPYYADLLDPDTQGGINKITEWEKVKVGLFWFALYAAGAVLMASLY
jgi:hypothetical protein